MILGKSFVSYDSRKVMCLTKMLFAPYVLGAPTYIPHSRQDSATRRQEVKEWGEQSMRGRHHDSERQEVCPPDTKIDTMSL